MRGNLKYHHLTLFKIISIAMTWKNKLLFFEKHKNFNQLITDILFKEVEIDTFIATVDLPLSPKNKEILHVKIIVIGRCKP